MRQTMKSVWRKGRNVIRGFTLGEIVTTVAIMGTLTAIAVPNFMRVKMNVNMELVKQHLKVIGEEMTGIMGKTGQFIAKETWGTGTTEDEMVITANLNGIKNKGYDTDQYTTDQNRATYQFRTCPQKGNWGISGDKCFVLDSSGLSEVAPWDGTGMNMYAWGSASYGPLAQFLLDTSLSQKSKIDILTGMLEYLAYTVTLNQFQGAMRGAATTPPGNLISVLLPFTDVDKSVPAYEALFPKAYEELNKKGIQAYYQMKNVNEVNMKSGDGKMISDVVRHNGLAAIARDLGAEAASFQPFLKISEVSFKFDDPVTSADDALKRRSEIPTTIKNYDLKKFVSS